MNKSPIGQSIAQRRQEVGLSQADLAEMSGVSVHALSNIETGKGNPTLKTVGKIAEVLGMEIELRLRKPNTSPLEPSSESSESA